MADAGSEPLADPAATEGTPAGPSTAEQALARRSLIVVGAGYLLVQLLLFSYHRAPGWDESVYLSQVMPGAKAAFFGAFRARGITLLIAPAAGLGGTVGAVRLYLVFVSTALLVTAFWLWIPVVGSVAPVAAALLGFSWLGLVNGSEVLPNLWAALLGVAVAGLVLRRLSGPARWAMPLAAACLGLLALFRPTEATVATLAIGIFIFGWRRDGLRLLLPLGLGLAAGWLPWVVEMSLRFDGPLNALRQAGTAHFAIASAGQNLIRNLAYTDGRILRPASQTVPLAGALWWGWLVGLTVVAFAKARNHRGAVILSSLGAAALALEYLVFVSALAPRYLLPAYAFASIPAATGLLWLVRDGRTARVAGAITVLLLIPWAIWQGGVAHRFASQHAAVYGQVQVVGSTIRQAAAGRACTVLSVREYPEIALASGCAGQLIRPIGPTPQELEELSAGGRSVFIVFVTAAPPQAPLGSFTPVGSSPQAKPKWFIYRFSP